MNLLRRRKVALKAVEASVSTSDVERDFYNAWAQGDRYWWWICLIMVDPAELIVQDEDGDLYRMSYSANDDGTVDFGEPSPVRMEFVDAVSAGDRVPTILAGIIAARGDKVAAKYDSRENSRQNLEGDPMREKIAKLRAKLRLGDDVSDEEVLAAAAVALEAEVDPDPDADPDPDETEDDDDDEADDPDPEGDVQAGAVKVDAGALRQLQKDAALGVQAHKKLQKKEHGEVVDAAIKIGKIPPRSRESYMKQMERDSKGTTEFLSELAENVVPVKMRGAEVQTDTPEHDRAATDAWLAARMPDVYDRKQRILAGAANSRVMTDG